MGANIRARREPPARAARPTASSAPASRGSLVVRGVVRSGPAPPIRAAIALRDRRLVRPRSPAPRTRVPSSTNVTVIPTSAASHPEDAAFSSKLPSGCSGNPQSPAVRRKMRSRQCSSQDSAPLAVGRCSILRTLSSSQKGLHHACARDLIFSRYSRSAAASAHAAKTCTRPCTTHQVQKAEREPPPSAPSAQDGRVARRRAREASSNTAQEACCCGTTRGSQRVTRTRRETVWETSVRRVTKRACTFELHMQPTTVSV